MTRTGAVLAAAALAALPLAPPAAAEDPFGTGFACASQAVQQGRLLTLTLTGGPITTADPADSIVVQCTAILVVDGVERVVATSSSGVSQGVATVSPAVAVAATQVPTSGSVNLVTCTEVAVGRDGSWSHRNYDADHDPSNGAQCAPASSYRNDDRLVVWFTPPPVWGPPCVLVHHPQIPNPEQAAGYC